MYTGMQKHFSDVPVRLGSLGTVPAQSDPRGAVPA